MPSRNVVRPADMDFDGEVSAQEWAEYLESLEPDDSSEIDPARVRARVFTQAIDQTRDGVLTIDDLFLVFDALDKNVDLAIGSEEFPFAGAPRGSRGAPSRSGNNLSMASVLMGAADVDDDDAVSGDEWGAFIDGIELGRRDEIAPAMLAAWMDEAQAKTPLTGAAFSPGSILRWIANEIDANDDGVVSLDDMRIFFDDLDKDANGIIAADELTFSWAGFGRSRETTLPPLMPWQRNLDDALALVRATGKPLLICVNTKGEWASDSLARRRYRDPVFVELASGFIPLLVSPDRSNPRDHDDRGRRITDAKFGRVTDAEHIGIEAILFERYIKGERVAPRHLAVDESGEVLFDIFLVDDMTVVDAALREHGKPGRPPLDPAQMSEADLLGSPDALHREYLEEAFIEGDERARVRLASFALSSVRETQHPEILRLALGDPYASVAMQAAWTVARHPERASFATFESAFRIARSDSTATAALIAGLGKLAAIAHRNEADERPRDARNLHHAFEGSRSQSTFVDVARWRVALSWTDRDIDSEPEAKDVLARRLVELEERLAGAIDDRELNLAFAATTLRYAELRMREGGDPSFLLEDVVAAATRAARTEDGSRPDGRALAFVARANFLLSDMKAAADCAARALEHLVPWAGSHPAALALEVLAETRIRSIYDAMQRDQDWPSEWVADVVAARTVLLEHPFGNETFAISFLDFLREIGVAGVHGDAVRVALRRFPASGSLNEFLRTQALIDGGAGALETAYTDLDVAPEFATTVAWYEALAFLTAAERRAENNDDVDAIAAYLTSAERFRSAGDVRSEYVESTSHYICLALAGAARLQADREEWDAAIGSLKAGVVANPESVWRTDGLGNTPRDTANRLYRSLIDSELVEQAGAFRAFLGENGLELDS